MTADSVPQRPVTSNPDNDIAASVEHSGRIMRRLGFLIIAGHRKDAIGELFRISEKDATGQPLWFRVGASMRYSDYTLMCVVFVHLFRIPFSWDLSADYTAMCFSTGLFELISIRQLSICEDARAEKNRLPRTHIYNRVTLTTLINMADIITWSRALMQIQIQRHNFVVFVCS